MRMVGEMRATTSTPALTFATEKALRAQGRDTEAGLVKEALHSTPTRASKIAAAWKKSQLKESKFIHPYSPEEALALMIEADLSRKSYQTLAGDRKGIRFIPLLQEGPFSQTKVLSVQHRGHNH
jgi:hypothetical protein